MLTKLFVSLDTGLVSCKLLNWMNLDSNSCEKRYSQYLSCFYQIKNERSRTKDRVKSLVLTEMTLAGIICEFILFLAGTLIPSSKILCGWT